jgi:ParB family chromosome partitioning protein
MIELIQVQLVDPNPHQPRQSFEYQALEELIASIKIHGILQPLIVTKGTSGRFELVAGERRLRAAKTLGLKTVPAVVRTISRQSKLELALIENIQRKDLNPIEEGEAYQSLVEEFGLTQEEVARRVGKNRATVANTLRLLNLPLEIQKSLRDGRITMGHAKAILSAVEPSQQMALWRSILKDNLTVRGGEDLGRRLPGKRPQRSKVDPEIRALEDQLRDVLKTRVKISRKGERGTVVIDFYSNDELTSLIRSITE